jgi:uracil-DNA glycosylase family 4
MRESDKDRAKNLDRIAAELIGSSALKGEERARAFVVAEAAVDACRLCPEAGFPVEPRPIYRGRVDAPILVVGQAPGRTEMERGLPFIGPSGRRLMAWMGRAGFSEQEFREKCYFSAITKCFPGPAAKGDRRPTPREIALCRPHLLAPLPLLDPKVVLLIGQMAIEAFLEQRPLKEWVGRMEERAGRYWIPLPHPSGASLWLNQPEHRALVEQALTELGRLRLALDL